ncbi:MAG: DUF58 domain-containing protein [Thermoplasmata archaeon]
MVRNPTALTPRGAGALVGGFVVLLLAFYTTNVLVFLVALFLLGFVLAALLSFAVATRRIEPAAFTVQRVESSALVGVGGAGLVSLRLTSHLPGSFYAEVFDSHPAPLAVLEGSDRLTTWWTAGETLTLSYVVSPEIRGLFLLGPTVVVAHDPLGLAYRTVRVPTPWTVEAIVRARDVPMGHPVRLASMVVGQTSISTPGEGSDFRALREYQPHDELRRIAWTRSTQGTLYVREYERESQQDLLLVLDIGGAMATGVDFDVALEKAVEAGGEALRVAFDEGSRAGLLAFADQVAAYVPASRGSNHEFLVFRRLTGAQVRPAPSSLARALAYLRPRLERPTTLLIFSALAEDPRALSDAAAGLRAAGHRLYALVPDVARMYPELAEPAARTSLELLIEPEVARARRAASSLEAAGATVGFFGRDDAIGAVAQVYARSLGSGRLS